jgi:hypothetical protein
MHGFVEEGAALLSALFKSVGGHFIRLKNVHLSPTITAFSYPRIVLSKYNLLLHRSVKRREVSLDLIARENEHYT